jgi:hypothetical protein
MTTVIAARVELDARKAAERMTFGGAPPLRDAAFADAGETSQTSLDLRSSCLPSADRCSLHGESACCRHLASEPTMIARSLCATTSDAGTITDRRRDE